MAKRVIDNLFCVFDLSVNKAMHLSEPISTRVILVYDRNGNKKEIRILDKNITSAMSGRLSSWLEKNIEIDDLLCHMGSEKIDIDELKLASNS